MMYNRKYTMKTERYIVEMDEGEDMEGVIPVDLNGAFVAVDKFGKDNLTDVEDNTQKRFALNKGGGS